MALNLNMFKMSNQVGVVMNPAANVIQAVVLPTLATTSYYSAGLVVSYGTDSGDMPVIRQVSSGCGIGIIVFNAKTDTFYRNQIVGVALDGSIITCAAGTGITRNDIVGYGSVTSNQPTIQTIASGSGIGIALDSAAALGDIIRVQIKAGARFSQVF